MTEKNVFNIIYEMICKYKEFYEEPYIILVSPKCYDYLIKYANDIKWLSKFKKDINKIEYLFGIPVEISKYMIQEAICMDEKEYKKYCDYRFSIEWFEREINECKR